MPRRAPLFLVLASLPLIPLPLAGCDDAPPSPIFYDVARLRVPLQVYPKQNFYLDASQSIRTQGDITGYIFDPGNDAKLIVREPKLAYSYDREGIYNVSARLVDGDSLAQTSINVVPCSQPLTCSPPSRPCPPGYVCNEQEGSPSLCAPEQTTCTINAECPNGLICHQDTCIHPFCAPLPPVDPGLPDNTPCLSHQDCLSTSFCSNNICTNTTCDDTCLDHLEYTELLPILGDLRVTGLAYLSSFTDSFFFITLDGTIWRRGETYFNGISPDILPEFAPGLLPPKFIGSIDLQRIDTDLASTGVRQPFWAHLDFLPPPDASSFATILLSNFDPFSINIPILEGNRVNLGVFGEFNARASQLASTVSSNNAIGSEPQWVDNVSSFINSYTNPSTGEISVVSYQPEFGIFEVYTEANNFVFTYNQTSGAEICAIATDGNYVFAAENRIFIGEDNVPRISAARILQFVAASGEIVDIWPSAIGSTCALEIGPEANTLFSIQYSTDINPFMSALYSNDLNPFLAAYVYKSF